MMQSIPLYAMYGKQDQTIPPRFVHVQTLEDGNTAYDWVIHPHRHSNLHQFIWVDEGGGRVILDERNSAVQPPVLVSIPPFFVHGFRWTEGSTGAIVTAASGFVSDLLCRSSDAELTRIESEAVILSDIQQAARVQHLNQIFALLLDEYSGSQRATETAISGCFLMLFSEMIRLQGERQSTSHVSTGPGEFDTFNRFRHAVESHYGERWAVSDYARHVGVSERGLARLCRYFAGSAPGRIIRRRQMLEARRLLLYTNRTVAEIGYELGFEDPSYFGRFFAREGGPSPGEFRRLHSLDHATIRRDHRRA